MCAIPAEILDEDHVNAEAVRVAVDRFGQIDVLVNKSLRER